MGRMISGLIDYLPDKTNEMNQINQTNDQVHEPMEGSEEEI